jgi:AraC-like DNA-binding protein
MFTMEIKDIEWLENLDTLIHNAMSDIDLSAEHIAKMLNVSRSHLYRKLDILRGVTPNDYIQEKRFKHARQLLELGEVTSVKAAAHAVGMRKVRYFSEQFKARYGRLPSSFLK